MRKGWTLRRGRRAYEWEVYNYFLRLKEMERDEKKTSKGPEVYEQWQALLHGMEVVLGLTKRDVARIRAKARRQVRQTIRKR